MKDLDRGPASATAGLSLTPPQNLLSVRKEDLSERAWAALASRIAGPAGMGTSAARLVSLVTQPRVDVTQPRVDVTQPRVDVTQPRVDPAAKPDRATQVVGPDPAYAERPWGDGKASPLYCPVTERINGPLGEEVDNRLVAWAHSCGFDDLHLARVRKAGFGRLVMLGHPDCDDPDRLLVAAKMNCAWWAADDFYADDSSLGALPERLPPRLSLAMAAMDPVPPAGEFSEPLDERLNSDPVLIALRTGVEHMARYATPAQVQRVCYSTFAMFVSWTAYAAWRHTGEYPPAWEYLAARQHDSFYTSMTLIDVLSGYELTADLYYDPRVRRAAFQAGTASVVLNDLFSVAKDAADENPVCNMVLQIAADRGCSIEEATEVTVKLHNNFVHDFEAGHKSLMSVPNLELQRFMRGLRAWMGGGFEWHNTNPRYKSHPKP